MNELSLVQRGYGKIFKSRHEQMDKEIKPYRSKILKDYFDFCQLLESIKKIVC